MYWRPYDRVVNDTGISAIWYVSVDMVAVHSIIFCGGKCVMESAVFYKLYCGALVFYRAGLLADTCHQYWGDIADWVSCVIFSVVYPVNSLVEELDTTAIYHQCAAGMVFYRISPGYGYDRFPVG